MYKNYVQRLLFLLNMVTGVMHLAITVHLDGGKPDTSAGFHINRSLQPVVDTFNYRQLLGGGGIEFSLSRMPFWNGS